MHNGFLNVEGEKMSKSLGNFFTVRDLLDRGIPGEVIRLVLLSTHYRQPMDWTEAKVHEATVLLTLWEKLLCDAKRGSFEAAAAARPSSEVLAALGDDLNTPRALKGLRDLASVVRRGGDEGGEALGQFVASLSLMGISPDGFRSSAIRRSLDKAFGVADAEGFGARIAAILKAREAARAARDFGRADALRDGLVAAGIKVMDRPGAASAWEIGLDFDPARLDGIDA